MRTRKILFLFLFVCLLSTELFSQTVYITKTGAKYHSSGCQYLRRSSIPIELKDALDRGYSACSRCNPPTQVNKKEKATINTQSQIKEKVKSSSEVTSSQCQAITKKGTQCKRKAEPGSKYCWQHSR
ncbi:MAG: hypothetical protein NTX65_05100 [Ignavibacteriales bacterium]|nr:hypothetical protein [Ignavibacteriales bacterium]